MMICGRDSGKGHSQNYGEPVSIFNIQYYLYMLHIASMIYDELLCHIDYMDTIFTVNFD